MQQIEISKVHPADYNARYLSPEAFETLKKSITSLGILKPIIVNATNNVIIAGHQRTKAMTALGITTSPCYMLNMKKSDEVRFNQIHNVAEYEIHNAAPKLSVKCKLQKGYNRISHKDLQIINDGKIANYEIAIGRMIMRYGEFCAPIAVLETGEIIVSAGYAKVAKLLHKDMDIIAVPQTQKKEIISFFSKTYGEYSYAHIEKHTYNQTFAQMHRLSGPVRQNKSSLYEQIIMPYLSALPNKGYDLRILDFGAGEYGYAKLLEKQGYNIHYVDPYHRKSVKVIDIKNNTLRLRKICTDLLDYGQYDIVICDSVLNSTDSKDAEEAVINTVFALTKPNGTMFFAGRDRNIRNYNDKREKATQEANSDQYLRMFDKDGFTGNYRHGEWFFQRFHTQDEWQTIAERISTKWQICKITNSWKMQAVKDKTIEEDQLVNALRFEFSLPLPNNKRYELEDEIEYAYRNRKLSRDSAV